MASEIRERERERKLEITRKKKLQWLAGGQQLPSSSRQMYVGGGNKGVFFIATSLFPFFLNSRFIRLMSNRNRVQGQNVHLQETSKTEQEKNKNNKSGKKENGGNAKSLLHAAFSTRVHAPFHVLIARSWPGKGIQLNEKKKWMMACRVCQVQLDVCARLQSTSRFI